MLQTPAKLQHLIEPVVVSLGYELVGVEYIAQGKHSLLRVYIDSDDGIKLNDCSRVSHQLSGLLDVEDLIRGKYHLEISSPGLDRPIFSVDQFRQQIGSNVQLQLSAPLNGKRKYRGKLCHVSETSVVINIEDVNYDLPISNIKKANVIPNE